MSERVTDEQVMERLREAKLLVHHDWPGSFALLEAMNNAQGSILAHRETKAKLEAAEKAADWWRTRVARLSSMEAFGLSRMIDQKADAELLLRIKYAECALTEGPALTTKETTDAK